MPTRYFKLTEVAQAGTWSLGPLLDGQGQELEPTTQFTSGHPVASPALLKLRVRAQGRRRDFNLAGDSRTPVVHIRMATHFAEFAPEDVQLLPVRIKGCSDEYSVLVATRLVEGIDPRKDVGALVFRASDPPDALIVSEHLKVVLERARLTGVSFEEVSTQPPSATHVTQ
ncbi:hypothetical protein [Myxococcus landrumensis]|uniref:Lipoprotein n=1 Tax=Myxococcus landrumensis TaxID=2813577 RepID=A0ABX7N0X3_9BACT|nr:hypothetical protein [Myxococcus landrumus]QSQ12362.1 hypothetical protein JY572_28930 [Myxococcus landrumus]